MLVNKAKRLKYLGFNDFWFTVTGILILSFATDYLFSNSFSSFPFLEALINWGVSLFFSTCDWFIMRAIMIYLRRKYPALKDSVQRIALFFVGIVTTVLVMDYVGMNLLSLIYDDIGYHFIARSRALLSIVLISTMTMAIYEAIYFYVRLKKSVREEEQAKQAIVQAQLDALRNQSQPHFFFNTLNTLRDIIDQNSREDAKKFVDRLSEMYRYLLESGNNNLISLKAELRFAKAYIHIQTERFGESLKVNWQIPNSALDAMIVPMSVQLLLENAIKHNIVSKANPLEIYVLLKDHSLIVQNRMQPKSTQLPSTKVGLRNIERRYALLSGKSIEITNDGRQFTVSLPLLDPSEQDNGNRSTYY